MMGSAAEQTEGFSRLLLPAVAAGVLPRRKSAKPASGKLLELLTDGYAVFGKNLEYFSICSYCQ